MEKKASKTSIFLAKDCIHETFLCSRSETLNLPYLRHSAAMHLRLSTGDISSRHCHLRFVYSYISGRCTFCPCSVALLCLTGRLESCR